MKVDVKVSILCFYRDLEAVIDFHFWLDFVKFLYANTLFKG